MKATIILLLITANLYSQEVKLNEEINLYEYSHVKDLDVEKPAKIDLFLTQLRKLNYTNIESGTDFIKADNFVTKMIFGSAMEVHYNLLLEFKENRYKLLVNNFKVKDVRYGSVAIETLKKRSTRKWVGFINEELPLIISNIETVDDW
jgi:hypothetical protein